jgi:hypothetical protein
VDQPHGQVSRLLRRVRSTTIPSGVKVTAATLVPGIASILLNEVVARTRPLLSSVRLVW